MSDSPPKHVEGKYAWRTLARKDPPKRPASERLSDFLEIYTPYDETRAREQANRCVQCPEPACVAGCPLSHRIPDWMSLTAEGQFLEAAALLQATTNLPEICARLCPSDQLCESLCILGSQADPVSVRAIEQFLSEYAMEQIGGAEAVSASPSGWRVAVLGAGPAGLACADELSRRGYAVTIYDAELLPGGLLVHGLPAFRMDQSILQRRIKILQDRGVMFRMGVTLGQNITYEELQEAFDAVFMGMGAAQARPLRVPGAELAGVVQAVPFLVRHTTGLPLEGAADEVQGKRVAVLGAGDTAMDCLRTALRCGALEAVCVYRRDQASMPCSRREYENAVEEGARFAFLTAPLAVLGNEAGEVSGLRLIQTELATVGDTGSCCALTRPGTEFEMKTDRVVLALGFDAAPLPQAAPFTQLATNAQGGVIVDEHQMTPLPGLFAGGDIVRGPSTVLDAVRDAHRAAVGIDHYLRARKP